MRRVVLPILAVHAVLVAAACGSRTGIDLAAASAADAASPIDSGADSGGPPPDRRDSSSVVDTGIECLLFQSRVFLTSTMYDGALGGTSGADADCTERANAAGLGGAWRAWLSDSLTPAPSRIYHAPGGYILLDGTLVAPSFDGLVSASLLHPIDMTELGAPRGDGNTEVWTGIALPGANANDGYCSDGAGNDWATSDRSAPFPFVGHSNATDATWTAVYLQYCNRKNVRLYCFETCD